MAAMGVFAAIAILGAVGLVSSVEVFNGICPLPNGDYGNPTSQRCKTYVRCQGGIPSNRVCPPGRRFDFVLRQCLARRLVDCRGQKAMVLSLPNALIPAQGATVGPDPIGRVGGYNPSFAGLPQSSPQVAASQNVPLQIQPLPLSGGEALGVRRAGRKGRQVTTQDVPASQGQGLGQGRGQSAETTESPTFSPVTEVLPPTQALPSLPPTLSHGFLADAIAALSRGQGQTSPGQETAQRAMQGSSIFP